MTSGESENNVVVFIERRRTAADPQVIVSKYRVWAPRLKKKSNSVNAVCLHIMFIMVLLLHLLLFCFGRVTVVLFYFLIAGQRGPLTIIPGLPQIRCAAVNVVTRYLCTQTRETHEIISFLENTGL